MYKFNPEILTDGFPLSGGVKQAWGGENKLISCLYAPISRKRYDIPPKLGLVLITNRKLHIYKLLIGTKVDDLG